MNKTQKELLVSQLIQNDGMVKELGIISKELVRSIYEINPSHELTVKVKGSRGDRGLVKMNVDSILSGAELFQGEYISQVMR